MSPARAPSTPTRPRARRGEGARLREVILDAAERLLIETGSEDGVSIRALAQAVGVTPPSIYLHFADKEQLIREVCDRQFATFDATVEAAGATTDDPVESLRRRAHAYVGFGLENPEQYRILFMGRPRPGQDRGDLADLPGSAAFGHLVDAVQRAIAAGALRPRLDAFLVAVGLWTAAHGITSALISQPAFPWPDVDTLVGHVCDTVMLGVVPRPRDQEAQPEVPEHSDPEDPEDPEILDDKE